MMTVLALVAALRVDGPAMTPAAMRDLLPVLVGYALLAPDHPPIVEARIGPLGMVPPTPPGRPTVTDVRPYASVQDDPATGFCRKAMFAVKMAPVEGYPLPPARPASLETRTVYRLPSTPDAVSRCEGRSTDFFTPEADLGERAFAVIRALASLKDNVGDRRPAIVMSVDDARARDYRKADPALAAPGEITDAAEALAALPLDTISWIGRSDHFSGSPLTKEDLARGGGESFDGVTLALGGDWVVGLALDGDRIVRLRMRRAVPPPF